ncbi:MAG TPA: signal peptide peptidase SppA [Candidatus Dormibacteraeota bacterium]
MTTPAPWARRAALGAAAAAAGIAATAAARSLPRPSAVSLPDPLLDIIDRRRIAVLPLKGVIGGTLRAPDVTRQLDRLRDDGHIRAVVLDIDSPGGSAIESEALFLATKRLAARKPVVAWIRGTGASGSYFAACGATRLLAFPGAIVGSIGVISARPILADVLRRIGASMEVTKTGPFKDLGAPWREPTEADRAKERQLVDGVFKRFTGAVAGARGFDARQLKKVTTGEVWLAEEALGLGLIDGLAEEEEAHVAAQELAGLPRKRIVRIQRRRNLAQRLGLPGATMDGSVWLAELEGWLSAPRLIV